MNPFDDVGHDDDPPPHLPAGACQVCGRPLQEEDLFYDVDLCDEHCWMSDTKVLP